MDITGRKDNQSKHCSAPGSRTGQDPMEPGPGSSLGGSCQGGEVAALSFLLLGHRSSCPALGSSVSPLGGPEYKEGRRV